MSRRNRPSAFDVSFPGEAASGSTFLADRARRGGSSSSASNRVATPASSSSTSASRSIGSTSRASSTSHTPNTSSFRGASAASSSSSGRGSSSVTPGPSNDAKRTSGLKNQKRRAERAEDDSDDLYEVQDKRPRTDRQTRREQIPRYQPHEDDLRESADTTILGEDPDEAADAPEDEKPIRLLRDFVIFDQSHQRELISLKYLDERDESRLNREFEAAGVVAPVFVNEEDAAQEEDIEDDTVQRIHTTAIFRWTLNYAVLNDPLYIQSNFAWYILKTPAKEYRSLFYAFYRPHRVAQIVISTALDNPQYTYQAFRDLYVGIYDEFLSRTLEEEMIESYKPTILMALETVEGGDRIRNVPIMSHILGSNGARAPATQPRRAQAPGPRHPSLSFMNLQGPNVDLAVLRPENQNRTHVTPLIDQLASKLFREQLVIVGPRPRPVDKEEVLRRKTQLRARLQSLLEKGPDTKKPYFSAADQLRDEYWRKVLIREAWYNVGDVAIVPAGKYKRRDAPERPLNPRDAPEDATVADYFWFAKIVYINQQTKMFHVQWMEHASKTILQELSDSQELFLNEMCDSIPVEQVVDKAEVHWGPSPSGLNPLGYFCKMMYDERDASFTNIEQAPEITNSSPPDNCHCCLKASQRNQDSALAEVEKGFAFRGSTYHIDDYVMIKTPSGPCDIGQIVELTFAKSMRGAATVSVLMLGRISDIIDICPMDIVKDERHLYLTDQRRNVSVDLLIRKCRVVHERSYTSEDFKSYLRFSPYNFFAKYHFRTLVAHSWGAHKELRTRDVLVCRTCFDEETEKMKRMDEFLRKQKPLRALDPFGGIGAFGLGMEETSPLKVTYAVEVSPSAAKTYQKNSPHTVVYNQCANIILRYAIKADAGQNPPVPRSLGDNKELPLPPKRDEIDCIIAGFPCQPHSTLNMFQKADDRKSHLILNLLSWVDFFRPKYCFFENVRGFLRYHLNAKQDGRYRVTGGIEMGGLKFVVRALIAMNYQVRIALLQAAHYGTPQSRIRFFLIAAQQSCALPPFPIPIYDFPLKDSMEFKLSQLGEHITPISVVAGLAPFKFITIDDAIGDLPRFDWKNPKRPHQVKRRIEDPEDPDETIDVPILTCDYSKSSCGLNDARYQLARPHTLFQVKCREKPVGQLQHFTRTWQENTIERVVNIPLTPNADYKALKAELWQWLFSNPSSSTARLGFKNGLYGRLDQNSWFHTTITNVQPTSKQSWVLHPNCHRVITVRELARSQGFPDCFTFYSSNNNVKIMQRQIGNAVAWPVANALGRELRDTLFQEWLKSWQEAIVID